LPLVVLGTADRKEVAAIRTRRVSRTNGYAATTVGIAKVRRVEEVTLAARPRQLAVPPQ